MEENIEKNNNSNSKNIIIAVLIVIIIALIGAIVYFGFIKKDDKPVNNNEESNQQQEVIDDNSEKEISSKNNFDEVIKQYVDYNGKQSQYTISDNKLPAWETLYGSENYGVELSEEGKVYIYKEESESDKTRISNISNAIAVIRSEPICDKFYILLNNGDVYKYSLYDYSEQKFTATKINVLKNIVKFVSINSCPIANSGCDIIIGAIDNNNIFYDIYILDTED